MPSKAAWLNYVRLQPELGVPSLYYLWHMDNSPKTIDDQDLDVVREARDRRNRQIRAKDGTVITWRRTLEKNTQSNNADHLPR